MPDRACVPRSGDGNRRPDPRWIGPSVVLAVQQDAEQSDPPQGPACSQRRPQRPMPGHPKQRQRAGCRCRPTASAILIRRGYHAQNLARFQWPVGSQTAIALRDPAPPGSPHQPVSDQRVVDHENDEYTQRHLRRQRNDLEIACGRQGGMHAGAAQREAKDALFFQGFSEKWQPRGCKRCARPSLDAQARHSFTAAATCTACSSVRVSPDGR